jgi:hypothetical protein
VSRSSEQGRDRVGVEAAAVRRVEALDAACEEVAKASLPRVGVLEEEGGRRPPAAEEPSHEQVAHDRIGSDEDGQAAAGVSRSGQKGAHRAVGFQADLVVDDEVGLDAGRPRPTS